MSRVYMRSLRWVLLLFVGIWTVQSGALVPVVAAQTCINDWSESVALIKMHELISVEKLSDRIQREFDGKIVKTTLCETMGGFTYSVVVRTPSGRLETIRTDASDPASKLMRRK